MFKKMKLKKLNKKALQLYARRQQSDVSADEIKKEIEMHKNIIAFYEKNKFDKTFSHADLHIQESLRVAALLRDQESQYKLSKHFFDMAKFWEGIKGSFYKAEIHDQYIKECYREAYAFMKAAEEQEYPLAIRLHGLAKINGWGTEVNEEEGFKLIVSSIEKENSWDKATKIFEELGLNKPEFFASLTAMRKESNK